MVIISIVILVLIIMILMYYNWSIHNKIKAFSNINQKINSLNVLQDFMNAIGEDLSIEDKISKINEVLVERFDIKYSTIVAFDGAEYVIKATNVDIKHWETLKNLHTDDLFKECIANATSKYVTVENDEESLSYQKLEFGRAKSAMFFPLFIDSVYVGFWLIESEEKHAFDNLDVSILDVIKENIIAVLKTVTYQSTIENIVREDLFTNLKSAEYLYGTGKKIIDRYVVSTVCMFKVINLHEINKKFSRETGNKILVELSKTIKASLSNEYIFVRYMGPKFVIVFSGVDSDSVLGFIKDIKKYIEQLKIPYERESKNKNKKTTNLSKKEKITENASPKLNFVVSTYYKGTSMDGITKRLEEYLDSVSQNESDINYL